MIGDKIVLDSSYGANMGSIPSEDADGLVVLNKVNQDAYSSEYRFSDTDGRYTVKVRNSVEPAKAGRVAVDRHNVELTYLAYAVPGDALPQVQYVSYFVVRLPVGGSPDVAKALVGVLASLIRYDVKKFTYLPGDEPAGFVAGPVGGLIDRVLNSES